VTTRHYDVIVLGRSLGAIAAAALLARRDFRVLLFGQGQRPATYQFDRHCFRRRSFTLLAGASPAWRRILQELAQTPRFRRRARSLDPMFAVLSPTRRVEIPPNLELFSREVDREFPEVRQLVDELYSTLAHVNAAADAVFERDAVWPPGSFWEAIETRRVANGLPFVGHDRTTDLLGKFPPGHPFREIVHVPTSFATAIAAAPGQLPAFPLARLHGAWTRGVMALSGGADELEEFLLERIEAHGGVCRLDRKVSRIVVRRGAVAGVIEEGEEEPIGTASVISEQSGEALADLANGEGVTPRARRDWPRLTATAGRYVLSALVGRAALPDALPAESFCLPERSALPDPRRPVVHLQRHDLPDESGTAAQSLLVAEAVLPTRGPLTLLEAREAVLAAMTAHLPFLPEHLVALDSPHDGLPLYLHEDGIRREIDRVHVHETSPNPEPMQWQWSVEPAGFLELAGEPVRGPIPGSFLVGPTVLPALGQEGELLAAWGAARVITRRDRARQRMRRQMWSKIETG
jgi:hypothetical protein